MRSLNRLSLLLVAVLAQGCVMAEVEELKKRITGEDLHFQGVGDAVAQPVLEERTFEADIGGEMLQHIEHVELTRLVLLPREGAGKLEFVKSVRICAITSESTCEVIAELAEGSDARPADGSLPLRVVAGPDHTKLFTSGARLKIVVDYLPPPQDWWLEIDLAFNVVFGYQLNDLAEG